MMIRMACSPEHKTVVRLTVVLKAVELRLFARLHGQAVARSAGYSFNSVKL